MDDEMKEALRELTTEIMAMRTDLGDYRAEMSDFKHEMFDFKHEMFDFEREMLGFKYRAGMSFAHMAGDIHSMQYFLMTKVALKSDLARVQKSMDVVTAEIEANRADRRSREASFWRHEDTLGDHEKRIARLEEPKS